MKVIYDYQTFFQKHGGVSRCFVELAKHMRPPIDIEFSIQNSDNQYLADSKLVLDLKNMPVTSDNFISSHNFRGRTRLYALCCSYIPFFPSYERLNKGPAIERLKMGGYDIFHPTLYDNYFLPYVGKTPVVSTVHDMCWELFPDKGSSQWSRDKFNQVVHADKIIAVSENTKKDLIRIWNIPDNKIEVVYHGCPDKIDTSTIDRLFPYEYFLYVGMRGGRKNFYSLLDAFSLFSKHHRDVFLICTGSEFDRKEMDLISSLHLRGRVLHINADDKQLARLYSDALAFVYPSNYEGFGMPLIEAMTYSCPVIASSASCFPEIAGDAALYFHVDKGIDAIRDSLEDLYSMDYHQRESLKEKGAARAKKYDWGESSSKLKNVYLSLL